MCEIRTMGKGLKKQKDDAVVMDQETARYVEWVRSHIDKQAGKTQAALAKHLGVAHPQITAMLKGKRQWRVYETPKIAEFFGTTPPTRKFPLLGDVGAGGDVVTTDWPGGEPDMVDGPEDAPVGTVAVRIKGESLGPGLVGWYAFYNDRRDPFDRDWLGLLCVVGTEDGRTLIKWVREGAKGFNLVSGTGSIEENVQLAWAAKVIDLRQPR